MADTPTNTAGTSAVETPAESNAAETQETSTEASDTEASPVQQDLQAAPKTPIKAEVQRLKKLKLKIDGREYEENLPFEFDDKPEIKEYLERHLQKAKAFDKRSQEYSQLTKEVGTFLEDLKKNPKKVLGDPNIGLDLKKLAASIIEEEIENSKKSPEQLQREKLEEKLKSIEEERKKEKEEFQRKEFERLQAQEYERYDIQISQALEKSDLPKSPYVIKKIADYMLMGLNEGMDISPADVLPLVRNEIQSDLHEMFKVMPAEVIEKIVGKDVFAQVRKRSIAKSKEVAPLKSVKDTGGGKKDDAPKGKQSFKDFFKI